MGREHRNQDGGGRRGHARGEEQPPVSTGASRRRTKRSANMIPTPKVSSTVAVVLAAGADSSTVLRSYPRPARPATAKTGATLGRLRARRTAAERRSAARNRRSHAPRTGGQLRREPEHGQPTRESEHRAPGRSDSGDERDQCHEQDAEPVGHEHGRGARGEPAREASPYPAKANTNAITASFPVEAPDGATALREELFTSRWRGQNAATQSFWKAR